jgi:peptide/nickel transport system permease protein
VLVGGVVLLVMLLVGLAAPLLGTISPSAINPSFRNKVPGVERTIRADDGARTVFKHRMGTDSLGRDVYSRVVYGARVSLLIGVSVAAISVAIGSCSGSWPATCGPLDG